MIRLYGLMGYLNHVDLLMPHVYCALKLFCEFYPVLTDKYMFKVNKLN